MFTAKDVKELRERTGCGMMDCKAVLTEADGDMDKAIELLREKGLAKAAKKAGRIAAEGIVSILADGNKAVMIDFGTSYGNEYVAKEIEATLTKLSKPSFACFETHIILSNLSKKR